MLKCEGDCEEHRGEVKEVLVRGWGYFNYCKEAIEEDIRRGLIVVVYDEEDRCTKTTKDK